MASLIIKLIRSTLYPAYRHEKKIVIRHTRDNNLFYGMRGAGASFAIATEFLYKINPTPETQPAAVMVWADSRYLKQIFSFI